MTHLKHKKYRLESIIDNIAWVYDIDNKTQHRCFILDHKIGDEFYLFEKETNIFNGNKTFEYSILNLYEIGKSYQFDIIKETDKVIVVSNYSRIEFGIPLSFKESVNQNILDLKVYDLDLDNNKLKFTNKKDYKAAEFSTQEIDYSSFEENQIYTLPIVNSYYNKNNNLFAVIEHLGNQFKVNIPPTLSQEHLDDNISIQLGSYSDGNPTLRIVRSYITSKLFKVGYKYHFIIEKQINNPVNGMVHWSLKDQYGMYNNYYPSNDMSFDSEMNNLQEGDSVSLYVFRITEKGYLGLVCEFNDWERSNYLVEDVFEAIGYVDQEDTYFFNLLTVSENTEDSLSEKNTLSFIDQYNDGENLWVFTYLAYLDLEIFKKLDEGEYEEVKTIIDIYIKIEKWILEGSDYLKNFSLFKTSEIIQKAESKIEKLEAMLSAIDLYLEDKDQEFLSGIKDSLNRTPYLSKTNKNILKELVKISQFFNADSNDKILYDTVILMIKHGFIQDDDRYTYIRSIESKIARVRDKVLEARSENFMEDENQNLRFLVSNQYLLVIFYVLDKNYFKASISSVNLLRFLAFYNNDVKYLNLAIELSIKQGYLNPNIHRNPNVYETSFSEIKKLSIDPPAKEMYCSGAGRIFYSSTGLEFVPKNLYRKNLIENKFPIVKLDTCDLFISSTIETDIISVDDNIYDLLKKIIEKITFTELSKEKKDKSISNQILHKIYSGRIKSFHNENQSICYLKCDIDGIKKDILLHINSFQKVKVLSILEDFFKVNDLIHFEITGIDGHKITISPKFALDEYANECLHDSVETIGKIVKVYENKSYAITQEGWPVFLPKSNLSINDTIKITVTSYSQEHQSFYASHYKLTQEEYIGKPEENYRNYLIEAGVLEETIPDKKSNETIKESESNNNAIVHQYDPNLKVISDLILNCLEQRLFYIKDPKELAINYFFLITISSVVKSHKSFIYNTKLNNLVEIVKLEYQEDFELTGSPIIGAEQKISTLQFDKESEVFALIKFINTDILDLPINLSSDSNFYILKKLVESNNLLYSLDKTAPVLTYLRKIIINELYKVTITADKNSIKEFETVLLGETTDIEKESIQKVITNLGSESKNKEFKTSIFYSASEESQQKVILRTIAGFLNSYESEGSLFIGVDDLGDIKGLKNDLSFDNRISTLDNYQNHIQSLVVSAFPKEINALLDYKFHKSNHLDYLEIVIPRYDKPIPFENEFYQRQGVQTRVLKGSDLVDFMFRKANGENKIFTKDFEYNEISDKSNINQLNIEFQNEDFYADLKKEGERHTPSLSLTNENLLGYLYIFSDNTYMMSAMELNDYLFKIEITEKYKFANLLLCYDNACINKVEIRSVLNKTFNKRYMNAMSAYGNLMSIFPCLPNSEVAIKTQRFNKTYIKLFDVEKISEHRILGLKGNCIVQEDFDQVLKYHIKEKLPEMFDSFRRESKQGLGYEINKNTKLYNNFIEHFS
ncbi:AlbA family DNA-binding domain-containing protein [Empedobacter stercoris]|uniref:AlbA family DNA-binding domain-containing protein n=1 Tax=Empedobacter stercoris TaxID=1628248 RepID=UPI001CE15131|nr:ATP-binding protein [Empedobacter stercoris]MCA4776109.1 ATP-binding protein [Empedobacter stercoris]